MSKNTSEITLTEEERRQQRRREWLLEQRFKREHEERKNKMIQEYEKKRAEAMNDNSSQNASRLDTTIKNSKQGNICIEKRYREKSRERSGIEIVEKRELRKIKIRIFMQESFTSSSSRQNACEMNVDISNPEDISIPRRKDEGSRPIFERKEIIEERKHFENLNKNRIIFQRGDKSERNFEERSSTSKEHVETCNRNSNDKIIHTYRETLLRQYIVKTSSQQVNSATDKKGSCSKSTGHLDENDSDEYERDRDQDSPRKDRRKHIERVPKRSRSRSRSNNDETYYRSRSLSARNAKETKADNDEIKSFPANCSYGLHYIPVEVPYYAYHHPRLMRRQPFNYWPPRPGPYCMHNGPPPFHPRMMQPHPPRVPYHWNKENANQGKSH